MTLLELLVQELPKRGGWPENAVFAVQDNDGLVKFGGNPASVSPGQLGDKNTWQGRWNYTSCYDLLLSDVAIDWSESKIESFEYESALAASKQVAWDGEGLPPVEMKVEWLSEIYGWIDGTVAGHDEKYPQVAIIRHNGGYAVCNRHEIRTEAERRREEAIKQMMDCSAALVEATAGLIYDAVAAGEIKAFKLAD